MPVPSLGRGLHVHRSESAQALVDGLAGLLATPPADPFDRDVVAVPARGVERWITQQMSARLGAAGRQDGVCARVEFPRPGELLHGAVAAVSPRYAQAVDAWRADRAVWVLLRALDDVLREEPGAAWCAALHRYLAVDGGPSSRRYGLARHVSGLFGSYAAVRPQLVRAWADGRDDAVPADLRWQPELWRRLRARLGSSPAELLDEACAALRDSPDDGALPGRLNVFGASRLDAADLQVLSALAGRRAVHLWVHSASPALWDAVAGAEVPGVRRAEVSVPVRNPLLASLSRDVRELQLRLRALPVVADVHHPPVPPAGAPSLLARLQADLRGDRRPAPGHRLAPDDRSVQVHACHGRARQVEVLREVLVGLLADDDTLEPRDVLVMCPDVEGFAPLVAAVFGADDHPGGRLRVSLADRSPRRVNPLLDLAATLLETAASRVTATQVLDLAGGDPVRVRFAFDDDDLERLREWTVSAGVRWGLDGRHRDGWRVGHLEQGTWRAGMDRLLAGVAVEQHDTLLGSALPVDEVDSSAIELAGRFAEFVDRLDTAVADFGGRYTVAEWVDLLERHVEALGGARADAQWQLVALRQELGEVRAAAEDAGAEAGRPEIGLAEMTALIGRRLEGRPTTAGFRNGGMTVCTLTPMRSVPHRVVCLLGMDDGAFPRQTSVDGEDLLLRDPCLGERDARSEDRQLFLDALGAAGDHLVITYGGADVRTGAPLPPAVPVGELLDALEATAVSGDGGSVRDAVVVHHPLQPFDRRNFLDGALGRPGPFSFDTTWLAGAVTAAGERVAPAPSWRHRCRRPRRVASSSSVG
ncbi:exodeoxyribonuclease V subunit gamma [Blastococcus brunescens]|uniref:RecBCD enzyme subunit RecC n=1 Tax=Blastococcus brunescens TaxID=1564165 RepID=A0ABZ1B2J3_9ACTN|nr:exodeoxyribonuclease V subunit gamma [Blastococcus sp. BMG 8361]WRL65036.1 exodeoxyribonuclease V subunit gamma [Blastococcus sp. BMG 8361]